MSATQFAYACLGSPAWPSPAPVSGERCWLCGGPLTTGWDRRAAFAPTFTNHNLARVPTSDAACDACVYLSSKQTWDAYVPAHPELGLKTGHSMNWRNYSHAFWAGHHECPQRPRWRALLLNPPEPPFVFAISESGQKHLLFRAAVAESREVFPVQCEEDTLYVNRAALADCFLVFEALYRLGFSKDQILTGRYSQATILKVGLATWRRAEALITPYRTGHPDLMRLAAFCAQKEDE